MSTNTPHRTDKTLLPSSSGFHQAFNVGDRPVINAAESGGQYTWAPNTYAYVSEHPHVQQQAYCVQLSSPGFFSKLPAGMYLHSLCKSMFENRTKTFEGLSEKIDVEFGELKWGGRTMSVPVGGTRSLGNVTHNLVDVEGEPYTKLIKTWVTYGLNDPDTMHAKLVTLDDPGDMLIDDISACNIYFELTRNCRDVSHAALVVGMMPRETQQIELRRNKEESGAIREISKEFTGLIEFDTLAAIEIARTMLSRMKLYNPDGRAAEEGFKQKTAILESLTNTGILESMQREAAKIQNPLFMQ